MRDDSPENGRRTPAEGSDACDFDTEPISAPSVADPGDGVTAADRWRRQVDHGLEQLTKICGWCQSQLADVDIDSCHACRELGATDVWSPRTDDGPEAA